MVNSRNKTLRTILDSKNGLHLTMYISFDGDHDKFRNKLSALINVAEPYLMPVMSARERQKFLSPVRALGIDASTLGQMRGNIAIFRKHDFLRLVSIPVSIAETCIVADTFHIKPLVKFAQNDQDFLILGINAEGASLYKGSQSEFKNIGFIAYPQFLRKSEEKEKQSPRPRTELKQKMAWVANQVEEMVSGTNTVVFLAGKREYIDGFVKSFDYSKLYPETISEKFSEEKAYETCLTARSLLKTDATKRISKTMQEFEVALKLNVAKTNIFQVAKAAVKGGVEKLLVAEDLNIFGRIDQLSGGVSLHPAHLDHEDDCLLDDLAQTVLLSGGEVIVAKKSEIPKGRPIVAILKNYQSDLFAETTNFREIAV